MTSLTSTTKPKLAKPYKIWNSKRDKKVSITASSLQELLLTGSRKLKLQNETVTVVLEEDGTEVDEEGYFSFLPPDTVFMFIVGDERWKRPEVDSSTDEIDSTVFENNVSGDDLSRDLIPLLSGMQNNLTKIITLTDDQLQEIVDLDTQQLSLHFGGNIRFSNSLQDGCQRHLDQRRESKDAMDMLRIYQKLLQEGDGEDRGRKRRKV